MLTIRIAGEAERWNVDLAALRSALLEQPFGGEAELSLKIRRLLDSGQFSSLGGRENGPRI